MIISKNTQVALMWIVIIALGGIVGISIILRDVNSGFGTITFGATDDFSCKSENGELFSSETLSGKVWIGHFIDSNCIQANECVSHLNMYASIHENIKDNKDLTMISFVKGDESLLKRIKSEYIQKADSWKLLLTPEIDQFNIQKYQNFQYESAFIVDQNGIIRGIYDMNFINEAKKLITDIKKLI